MGPQSDNRGYGHARPGRRSCGETSMGPRSDNRVYVIHDHVVTASRRTSMGPRSDNRGYAIGIITRICRSTKLQWVHGQITVVMTDSGLQHFANELHFNGSTVR